MAGTEVSSGTEQRQIYLRMRFTQFELPPVKNALIIGKKSVVGPTAIEHAFEGLMPRAYQMVRVDHPIIEAILMRSADLRRVPVERLTQVLLKHAEKFMNETDTLHVELNIEIAVEEKLEE